MWYRTKAYCLFFWHCGETWVRLEAKTLFRVRNWERYQFLIDYEHEQARYYKFKLTKNRGGWI